MKNMKGGKGNTRRSELVKRGETLQNGERDRARKTEESKDKKEKN